MVNNCLNCGRIVCVQEGPGPCFFCDELVCSPEQRAILQSKSKQADALYNKLIDQKPSKNLEDSLKQRDKLLEYDRNRHVLFEFIKIICVAISNYKFICFSARRTKVIDDQSDYFQSNSTWLSTSEREKLQKQETEAHALKHMSRLDRRVVMDLTGREVFCKDQAAGQSRNLDEIAMEAISYENFENPNICPTIEFERPTVR